MKIPRRFLAATVLVLAASGILAWQLRERRTARETPGATSGPESGWAGSAACRECHPRAWEAWSGSHHALAERPVDPARDRAAFVPSRRVTHGSLVSEARERAGRLEILTAGGDGRAAPFEVRRAIGVAPLYQFLVEAPGGRLQVTSLAFDPAREEWFDVFGAEDRKPTEWGFWANRGMCWNSMCAGCHTTRLEKGYSAASDAYATRYLELGVGCEACHGPLEAHVAHQRSLPAVRPDPGLRRLSPDAMLAACGSCHARRADLTGAFVPGDRFEDHFLPVLPDGEAYYPDGQVRDEDFEYGSFISSRMHAEGVRCGDCHEPHSGKLKRAGNDLCLFCHQGKIDPGPHSHHRPGTPGGFCADCHMPVTTYMARHPRRDHGFTIPDPLLTRELGIPNACGRCHHERGVDWAVEQAERWYGARLDRPTRVRARRVARARAGDPGAVPELIAMAPGEPWPAWRSVAAGLLGRWADRAEAREALLRGLEDPHPLVRAAAARALDPVAELAREALRARLDDPVRLVRVEAAWALRAEVEPGSRAGRDLAARLAFNADQPGGLLAEAEYLLDRGRPEEAEGRLRRAVEWDPHSAPLRQALAGVLAGSGRPEEARRVLEEAAGAAPGDPDLLFALGLARAESGRLAEAVQALEEACSRSPQFSRAWYNLGLARARLGLAEEGLKALARAEELEPDAADYPAARAGVLWDLGRREEAREAASRALAIDPDHPGARAILEAPGERE